MGVTAPGVESVHCQLYGAHRLLRRKDAKMNLPSDRSKKKLFFTIVARAVGFGGTLGVILIAFDRHVPSKAFPILSPAIHILMVAAMSFVAVKYFQNCLKRPHQ
jgi:hypothetical protein